jgi:hypothetical protein
MNAWLVIQPIEFVCVLCLFVWLTKNLTAQLVANMNAISAQILAFAVILMGWGMLVACKKYAMDTTIAGGVIGVGSNMLQNKRSTEDTPPPPKGGTVKATETHEVTAPAPAAPPASE